MAVPDWFCCLNPSERSVIRSLGAAFPLTLFQGVPVEVWDSAWLAAGNDSQARRDAFLSVYRLEIVTIPPTEEEPAVTLVRPSYLPLWVDISLWLLEPAAACLGGCSWVHFP